jgi:hypothetical protein
MGERRGLWMILMEKPEKRVHLEEPGDEGRIIVRCIFRKLNEGVRTVSSWLS